MNVQIFYVIMSAFMLMAVNAGLGQHLTALDYPTIVQGLKVLDSPTS